jgi:hypothetical protein
LLNENTVSLCFDQQFEVTGEGLGYTYFEMELSVISE